MQKSTLALTEPKTDRYGEGSDFIVDDARMTIPYSPEIAQVFGRICAGCAAPCCYRFRLRLAAVKGTKRIDWKTETKRLASTVSERYNIQFMRRQFVPLQIDAEWTGTLDCTGTCRGLCPRTHRCKLYAKRPPLCRKFICRTAALKGVAPSPADSAYKMLGYAQMRKNSRWLRLPVQTEPVWGWREHVKPVIDALAKAQSVVWDTVVKPESKADVDLNNAINSLGEAAKSLNQPVPRAVARARAREAAKRQISKGEPK